MEGSLRYFRRQPMIVQTMLIPRQLPMAKKRFSKICFEAAAQTRQVNVSHTQSGIARVGMAVAFITCHDGRQHRWSLPSWQVMNILVTRCSGAELFSMHLCCDILSSPSNQQSMMSSNHADAEAPANAETSFSTKI